MSKLLEDYLETLDSLFDTRLSKADSGINFELNTENQLVSLQDSSFVRSKESIAKSVERLNKRQDLAPIEPNKALFARLTEFNERQRMAFRPQLMATEQGSQRPAATGLLEKNTGWIGATNNQSKMEHLLICSCAYCHNPILNTPDIELAPQLGSSDEADVSQALQALPLLSSNPNADAKIYLDFDGHVTADTYWNSRYSDGEDFTTPAYDTDKDTSTFSSSELNRIEQIWQRVAEDYAPFNVDVTTVDPGDFSAKTGLRVVIGGSSNSWYGRGAGGIAFVSSWRWNSDTPVYVFEDQLGNGNVKYTAEAISHEVGHALGLYHQSSYDSSGKKTSEYFSGSGKGETGWAPIMGTGYSKNLTTWHNGTNSRGADSYVDELAIISSDTNGFGYRADEHGNTNASATALTGTEVSASGIISTSDDVDVFSFQTGAGEISFDIDVASIGPNLDVVAELYQGNQLLTRSNPADRLDASLNTSLEAGTYYLHVKNNGEYGRLGQYTVWGNLNPTSQPDPILSVSDITVTEGDKGVAQALVTVELSESSTKQVTIDYETVDGSAIASQDYVAQEGNLTFSPGQTRQTISLDVMGDLGVEATETFSLQFGQATNAKLVDTTATVTIIDNDEALLTTMGEVGRVEAINHQQQTIVLEQSYVNPIIFAQPLSRNGSQTASIRIDEIESDRFTASIQEPGNLDGWHVSESFSYLVVEAGTWQLSDGTLLEAGTLTTNATTADSWATVNWETDFNDTPVVLSQLQSDNDADYMNLRQKNIGSDGFRVALEKEESLRGSQTATETIGWLALSSGQGSWNNLTYEAGYTGDAVTDQWQTLSFEQNFDQAPQLLASISSFDGPDSVGLRYDNLTSTEVKLMLDEDTSRDAETRHTTENVGYVAIEGSGFLTGQASTTGAIAGESDVFTGTASSKHFTSSPNQHERFDDIAIALDQDMVQFYGSGNYSLQAAAGQEAIYHRQQDQLTGIVSELGLDSLSFIS